MGISKSELFSAQTNEIAGMAKALGHPARVAILKYLLESKACINGDLVEQLGLAQATISQHLKELKTAGLIQGTIEGTKVNYCINQVAWTEMGQRFAAFFEPLDQESNCC